MLFLRKFDKNVNCEKNQKIINWPLKFLDHGKIEKIIFQSCIV